MMLQKTKGDLFCSICIFPSLGFVEIHPCKNAGTEHRSYILHQSQDTLTVLLEIMKNPQTPKDEVAPEKGRKCICILYYRLYMCIYHIYIYNMFVYHLEKSFTKNDVIFCCMQRSFCLRLPRELHLRWRLERVELRMGKSGVEFLAWTNEEQVLWNIKRCHFFTSILVNL